MYPALPFVSFGFPENPPHTRWDRKYLELAEFWANLNSKDPTTKVGAVVVNFEKRMEFLGYNGFPAGVYDTKDRLNDRDLKNKLVVHAEENALIKAGHYARGATLYVWPTFSVPAVCSKCAGTLIQYGIAEVVSYEADLSTPEALERYERWKDSIKLSEQMLREAGVSIRTIRS